MQLSLRVRILRAGWKTRSNTSLCLLLALFAKSRQLLHHLSRHFYSTCSVCVILFMFQYGMVHLVGVELEVDRFRERLSSLHATRTTRRRRLHLWCPFLHLMSTTAVFNAPPHFITVLHFKHIIIPLPLPLFSSISSPLLLLLLLLPNRHILLSCYLSFSRNAYTHTHTTHSHSH